MWSVQKINCTQQTVDQLVTGHGHGKVNVDTRNRYRYDQRVCKSPQNACNAHQRCNNSVKCEAGGRGSTWCKSSWNVYMWNISVSECLRPTAWVSEKKYKNHVIQADRKRANTDANMLGEYKINSLTFIDSKSDLSSVKTYVIRWMSCTKEIIIADNLIAKGD